MVYLEPQEVHKSEQLGLNARELEVFIDFELQRKSFCGLICLCHIGKLSALDNMMLLTKSSNQASLFDYEAAILMYFTVIDIDIKVCCFAGVIKALGDCDNYVAYF